MSRILVISDIHGCCDELNALLQHVEFDRMNDQLILLGDYVDRGPNSKETVEVVLELVQSCNAIALRGNHDQRLVDFVRTDDQAVVNKLITHGGASTIRSYCPAILDNELSAQQLQEAKQYIGAHYSRHIDFLSELPLYYEDHNHIFVHAGINPKYTNWKEQPDYDFMYIKDEFHRSKLAVGKTVIFGHTRTMELHGNAEVWFSEGKIGIDGGCAYGMQLNCLIIDGSAYATKRVVVSK